MPTASRPTSADRECQALRLALGILTTMLRVEVHTPAYRPFSIHSEARLRWVQRTLKPLAVLSPSVRKALAVLDLDRSDRRLFQTALVEADLRRTAKALAALAASLPSTR